ncbi:MAG: MASE1 domain-containing protein [Colwellia sp.]
MFTQVINQYHSLRYKVWLTYFFNCVLILLLTANIEYILYWFSGSFTVYKGWVSWYWPVGFRVACLVLFPFKYWPALILGGCLGQLQVHLFLFEQSLNSDDWSYLFIAFRPERLASYLGIALIKIRLKEITIEKLKPLILILTGCTFYRLVESINSILTSERYASIPEERKFEMFLAHFLGGFIAIMLIVPMAFLVKKLWLRRKLLPIKKIVSLSLYLIVFLGVTVFIYQVQPHTLYLMRILAIIPLVWFSYKYGWEGAITSSLAFNALLIFYVYGTNDPQLLLDTQLFVIAIALIAALLGALMSEHKDINKRLAVNNKILNNSNKELSQLSKKNQALANKVISIQEAERKKLSHELHDEIGQNISALKVELKVLAHSGHMDGNSQPFKHLNNAADRIYDSVYRVMHWLRPRVIDELGLKESLSGEYFNHILSLANIDYQCSIKGAVDDISNEQAITVFRIAQECVNNCIRHSQAMTFYLLLDVQDDEIALSISDDGQINQGAINIGYQGGFGLLGIEERIQAANGTIQFNTESRGFSLKATLPR